MAIYFTKSQETLFAEAINDLSQVCYNNSKQAGWYEGVRDSIELKLAKIALIHSEVSEALEGERKGLMDDKLPNRPMAEVELADAVIRILDYAGWQGYDIGGAIVEKMAYNKNREDHKPENRAKEGGKKL